MTRASQYVSHVSHASTARKGNLMVVLFEVGLPRRSYTFKATFRILRIDIAGFSRVRRIRSLIGPPSGMTHRADSLVCRRRLPEDVTCIPESHNRSS